MSHLGKRGDGCRKKKKPIVAQDNKRPAARWLRNKELAAYAGVSAMTLWRWKTDPELNFPRAAFINNIEHNDLRKFDAWMRNRPTRQLQTESAD